MRLKTFLVLILSLAGSGGWAFDLQGHRGARGLLPENTLPSFARALSIGVTTLETDIAITSDGVLVISHDPALNPDITRGPDGSFLSGRGPLIVQTRWAELQRYDVGRINPASRYAQTFSAQQPVDGTRLPTLAELFATGARCGAAMASTSPTCANTRCTTTCATSTGTSPRACRCRTCASSPRTAT